MAHEPIQKCIASKTNDYGAVLTVETEQKTEATVRIDFISDSLFHYIFTPDGVVPKKQFIDITEPKKKASVAVEDREVTLFLTTGSLSIVVNKNPWNIQILGPEKETITGTAATDVDARGSFHVPASGCVTDSGRVSELNETFALGNDEHFYGLGERFTDFDKRRQDVTVWNRNPYGAGKKITYKNIPFFISSHGYGVFLNTTAPTHFSFGTGSNFSYTFRAEDSTLDYYFFYGPSIKTILKEYTELTGQAPVLPLWSFGLWMSIEGEQRAGIDVGHQYVKQITQEIRERDIPADVLHFDPFWMGDGGYCNFEWGDERYPDPNAVITDLKEKGFKLCLWEHPYIDVETEMFREGDENGYFIKKEDGSTYRAHLVIAPTGVKKDYREEFYDLGGIVDFTNPKAVEWYKAKHRPLLEAGVAVFKSDFGEEIPADGVFYNGETGHTMHNHYAYLYNKTVYEVTNEYQDHALVWGRSAFAGSQKYPVQWSGDPTCTFESMAATLRSALSFGLSGFTFYSHDMGGFKGETYEKLFIRWAQFGLFSSHSRCHGTATRLPWKIGEQAETIFREYVKLRYRLLPYIYSQSIASAEQGLPLLRAMVLEYQDDPRTFTIDSQYMFGDSLLVAPVLNENGTVDIYLPHGEWTNYWTKKREQGPCTIKKTVPLEELPLFVKTDSIVPLAPECAYTGEKKWDPVTLDIYLKDKAKFNGFDENEKVMRCNGERDGDAIRFAIKGEKRKYELTFNDCHCPKSVTAQGKTIREVIEEEYASAESGWYFDYTLGLLTIKLAACSEAEVVIKT